MLTSSKIWFIPLVQYMNQTYFTKLEIETPWLAWHRERARARETSSNTRFNEITLSLSL